MDGITLDPMMAYNMQPIYPYQAELSSHNPPPYQQYPNQFSNSQAGNYPPNNFQHHPPQPQYPPQSQPNQVVYTMGSAAPSYFTVDRMMRTAGTQCSRCAIKTQNRFKRVIGKTAIIAAIILLFTVPFLFWLPCVIHRCKQVQIICVKCNYIKVDYPAECCR